MARLTGSKPPKYDRFVPVRPDSVEVMWSVDGHSVNEVPSAEIQPYAAPHAGPIRD
jgi:hypothetical protein